MNAHVRTLKPFGIPEGIDPRTWRQEVERHLNELLDRAMSLITALDMMEAGTEDLEDGADAEPSLGWGEGGPRACFHWPADGRGSSHDDRELECEDEGAQCDDEGGDINDQPHDGDELELDDADYDCPGFIDGGNEDGR
jgi:hypothetical protein